MSTIYEQSGRTQQKQRTRSALVAAARGLMAEGVAAPTVDAAAAAASVSRTTAYRYFPNQAALLIAAHPETTIISLLPPDAGNDPVQRLRIVVAAFTRLIIDTEAQQRTMLRLSLSENPGDLPLRKGRAISWFEDALEPLRAELGNAALHRLAIAIRSAVGIEALVWLTDVAGLTRDQAADLMQWTALSQLHHAMSSPAGHGR
ncbi:MAG: TetR family transcriptional regulator [Actinomycetota bacterium]|nr:TetR family transcriptional regulator [Actinomycetota bacterium]